MDKTFIVTYVSRYYPFEGKRKRRITAPSKAYIRNNWHNYIRTDEYRIVKIEEVTV